MSEVSIRPAKLREANITDRLAGAHTETEMAIGELAEVAIHREQTAAALLQFLEVIQRHKLLRKSFRPALEKMIVAARMRIPKEEEPEWEKVEVKWPKRRES